MFGLTKLLSGAAVISLGIAGSSALAETTYIHAGSVIADASGEASGPSTIIVTDGKIVSIQNGHTEPSGDAETVDLSGKTVLPGLIDLHTHLSGDPSGEFWRAATNPPEWYTLLAAKNARITALAGFTTVRDLGSRTDQVTQSLRRATASGVVPGPRIVTSARTIAIVGGHGDINGFRREVNDALGTSFACTGPTECAEMVRTASKYGADLIKITATGGVLSQQGRGLEAHFSDAEMKAIVDTAESLGLKVAAHAHGARGIEAAARAGVHTIEHGTYIDAQAGRVMRENGTILVPTLMAFQGIRVNLGKGFYTPVVENKIREVGPFAESIVERAREYGVKIAFGTDAGVFPHGQNAGEFGLMTKGGMTNRQALASATTVAAEVIGLENEIGRIAPGYSADIIAVDGNPLTDVAVLEDVDWVMVRGRIVE
ncbi:amidohydrolase family protein [Pontixanthobacter aestiaquae]|uniref:Amidohydrolase family protein n=1 Tax=Pontixanthobacter aestiaquae TaxID=1509367 RepID=A0A844Z5U9_9SPHN|nr:amidohydrolase family protein [Pontixanthobacter aestiaquae]MDN3646375.1 amidohydrolase family protein [Pontixanthobacter aestiaquae]MXO82636.1 amidohydrolase family protein [Pontixanthobacter aestiaquae]